MLSEEDASLDLCLKQWAEETTGELRSVLLSAATRIRALASEKEGLRRERVWRCFHCDEVFTTVEAAREHFGPSEIAEPGCCINLAEYRRMEENHERHLIEDDECSRQFHAMRADHATALRREEEKGYERGLRDAGPEALARAESSESQLSALRAENERLRKVLLRLQTGAAVALDALPEDQQEGVVGNFLAAIHRECCAGLCASKGADECKEATP